MGQEDTTNRFERPVRDMRIDRWIVSALGVLITVVLGFVGTQFNSLAGKVDAVVGKIETLTTKVAVFEAAGLDARVRALEEHVARLDAQRGSRGDK